MFKGFRSKEEAETFLMAATSTATTAGTSLPAGAPGSVSGSSSAPASASAPPVPPSSFHQQYPSSTSSYFAGGEASVLAPAGDGAPPLIAGYPPRRWNGVLPPGYPYIMPPPNNAMYRPPPLAPYAQQQQQQQQAVPPLPPIPSLPTAKRQKTAEQTHDKADCSLPRQPSADGEQEDQKSDPSSTVEIRKNESATTVAEEENGTTQEDIQIKDGSSNSLVTTALPVTDSSSNDTEKKEDAHESIDDNKIFEKDKHQFIIISFFRRLTIQKIRRAPIISPSLIRALRKIPRHRLFQWPELIVSY